MARSIGQRVGLGVGAAALVSLALLGAAASRSRASVSPTAVRVERDVQYGSAGGQRLLLDAYLPAARDGRPQPAVVFIHGGGWRAGDKSDFARAAVRVAQLGWAAFSINYRLEPPAAFPASIEDTLAAVRWVRARAARFGVDPTRLAAFGSSAGGNLAALVAVRGRGPLTSGTRVRAAVSWSGPLDLGALAAAPSFVAGIVTGYLGCRPAACRRRYAEASPVSQVDGSDAPVFLANSEREFIPLAQAKEMASKLAAARVPYELDVIPGDRHAGAYFDDAWPASLRFLERYLGPLPAAAQR